MEPNQSGQNPEYSALLTEVSRQLVQAGYPNGNTRFQHYLGTGG